MFVVSCNLETILFVQNSLSRIAQVEYQGQTLYTRILEWKPFNDTSYLIGLFFF